MKSIFLLFAIIVLSLTVKAQYNGEFYVTYAWADKDPYVSNLFHPRLDSARITKFKVGSPISIRFPERAQDKFIVIIYPWSEQIKSFWYNGLISGTLPGQEFRSYMVGKNVCLISRAELPFDATNPITIQ